MGDPAGIARLAAQVEGLAETVRGERRRLEAAAVGVDWHSSAAATFARRSRDASHLLARDVARLEDLAQALRGHAAHVQRNLEVLAEVKRRAQAVAAAGVDVAEGAADDAARVVGGASRWVGDHVPW
jgi:hypothetical protein